ncbi:TPA: HigA family addiction module antidote protein [Salmonella enterica]|uniref:HigA family addiction module antidote protein n=1 Tax=Salmonella enterica TaxID=28901 RepID=A0A757VYE7_SALER|nr:HigA family addiction module antitoxin [Salmonella enterica]EDW2060607.1 HigA family addiction module antidote protein [Salmonella enterica subsp. enterica serovar Oslo]EDY1997992.1 HigA family addiction module antidote protein [Salmonella enterica subsp. diarizonae]EHD9482411.1 HigA family addiction module antidote protein [Salmonella enterica subsp. enterica serovar Typhimurium]EAS3780359.1 addiction module antidote protein, HigA family [Salmonella enterica]EEL2517590.1 HigA family addict
MRQFKISHPGEIIARDLEDMGISGRRFALNIGVTPATVSRFLAGKTALTPSLAIRIAAALGSTPEFWLRLQSAYDLRQLENKIDTSGIVVYGEQGAISQVTSKH